MIVLGFACVFFAVVIMAMTKFRDWLVFMALGAMFWLSVEVAAFFVRFVFATDLVDSYVATLLAFAFCATAWAIYKDDSDEPEKASMYVEHTPLNEEEHLSHLHNGR